MAAIVPHLVYQLQKLGLDVAAGPAEDVIALRERVQTLKEMAEAVVWYQPLTGYDEAAVAKHLKAGAEVALGKARELLAALPEWTAESVGVALRHGRSAGDRHGQGRPAAARGHHRHPGRPDISHTVYLAGRERPRNALMRPSPR